MPQNNILNTTAETKSLNEDFLSQLFCSFFFTIFAITSKIISVWQLKRKGMFLLMYANFSQVYDQLNGEEFYHAWFEFLQPYLTTHNKVLDLGCGSGTLLAKLLEQGHLVTGVDLSVEMLAIAKNKLESVGSNYTLYEEDMADFYENNEQYDIIISTCDSINYLNSQQKVAQLFSHISTMLKPEGFFLFDVHSDKIFEEHFPSWSYADSDENVSVLWNTFTTDGKMFEHDLTFFIKQYSGTYQRFDERHQQYFYKNTELTGLLQQYFSNIQCISDFTDVYNKDGDRDFYIIKKTKCL